MKDLNDTLEKQDKVDLARSFKIKHLKPGQKVYKKHNELDSFYLIVEGHIGIFYPDHQKVKEFETQPSRIVYLTEEDA